jgi:hypothetical protein
LRAACRLCALSSLAAIACFFGFAAVFIQLGPGGATASAGYGQVSDLVLTVGSLLGLLTLRALETSGILGGPEALLAAYARRQEVADAWSRAMRRNSVRLFLIWVCSALLRGLALWKASQCFPLSPMEKVSTGLFVVVSFAFVLALNGILCVCCALTEVIDTYVMHLDQEYFTLETSVFEWNLLQAVLRQASGATEKSFLAIQSTALALSTAVVLAAPRLQEEQSAPAIMGDAAWMSSVMLLVAGAMLTFFKAAEVSERCLRIPALINSLNFGKPVDTRRHYLVEFISYSAAGFYVGEVRLTSAMALKLTYLGCVLVFAALSRLFHTMERDP